MCHFARLEGHRVPQMKIQTLVIKPDEDVMVIENDCVWKMRDVCLVKQVWGMKIHFH